jgi:hypothetical protein
MSNTKLASLKFEYLVEIRSTVDVRMLTAGLRCTPIGE